MKKKGLYISVTLIMLLALAAEAALFASGVSRELWSNSIQTMMENSRQGANAVNIQLEDDFLNLERMKEYMVDADDKKWEEMPDLCKAVEPDVVVYFRDGAGQYAAEETDEAVSSFLERTNLGKGIVDAHISNVTGENVFNIFVSLSLPAERSAYLVKEYRTKEVAQQFTLTFYDYTGFSYLVKRDGTIMVRSRHRNSNKTNANLFDMISPEENDGRMVEMFRKNISESRTGWAKFTYKGSGLVFCYEPLRKGSEWLLVSIVPEHVITSQTRSILMKTIAFAGAAAGIVLVVVVFFYGIKQHENKKHTRELQEALDAADAANRAKGQFLMNMSHDVRTPLNAIIGMTAIAQQNSGDKNKTKECLQKIKVSGKHLLNLVNDVLDMSQIEHGEMILKEEPINLLEVYREVIEQMGYLALESEVALDSSQVKVSNEVVAGDPLRIRQVLINIVGNAIKYTEPGGYVDLEFSQSEDIKEGYAAYRFRCKDTGIGMEPKFLEKIFVAFERGRNTTDSKVAGIGVGLAITKSLLDLMGGSISVESELGKGSVFTVEFHFRIQGEDLQDKCRELEEKCKEQKEDCEKGKTECREISDYSDKRILLVEDVEINMEIAEAMLGAMGVQIEKAYDGREAVEMVMRNPAGYYDLIFMDIQMPIMDGYEATRQIRGMDREDAGSIPIFALSANALAEDVKNSRQAGMNGHLAKPIDMGMVARAMQQYL